MLLKNRNAIIYGAGGAVGSTIARAYAREGARLVLVGRTLAKVDAVARDIISDGGAAEAAQVDALNEQAIERHATEVVRKAGRLDISFNAVGIPADVVAKNGMQGVPFTDITLESFAIPGCPTGFVGYVVGWLLATSLRQSGKRIRWKKNENSKR